MALPIWIGAGGAGLESMASGSPGHPTDIQTGDIELLVIETNGGQPGTTSTSGWTQLSSSPQDSSASCLAVYWHRYTAGDAVPTVNDSGDHQIAYIFSVRRCP